MTRLRISPTLLLPLLLTLAIAGCGDDSETDPGTAPAISELTYDPQTAQLGQQTTITGTFTFEDPEADANRLDIEITLPDGSTQMIPAGEPQGVAGQTAGTVAFALLLQPPAAGAYPFELWLTDAQGNESNRLQGTVEAE